MILEVIDQNIESKVTASEIGGTYRLWLECQINGRAPFSVFSPEENVAMRDSISVLTPAEETDFIFAVHDANSVRYNGVDLTGWRLSDIIPKEYGLKLIQLCQFILYSGKPILLKQRTTQDERVANWERLFLPCIDDEGRDVISVFVKRREHRIDLLNATIEASPDGMMLADLVRDGSNAIIDARVQLVNERMCLMSGMTVDQMIGRGVREVFSSFLKLPLWRKCVAILNQQKLQEIEYALDVSPRKLWLKVRINPVGERVVVAFTWITKQKMMEVERLRHQKELEVANAALAHEINRRRELEEELRRLATLDPLTGLKNRRAISEEMSRAMTQAERFGHGLSLIAIDIDHFKAINSRYGHGGGDEILKTTARLFNYGLREDIDVVGRMGGEEFLAILPNTSLEGAVSTTERLRRHFEGFAVPYQKNLIHFTASFGVCEWNGRESMDDVIRRADNALMQAKTSGRNIVVVDTGDGHRVTLRRMSRQEPEQTLPLIASEPLAAEDVPPLPKLKKIRLKAPRKTRSS